MIWFVGAVLIAAAVLLGVELAAPSAIPNQDDQMQFVYGITLLVLLGSSVVLGMRTRLVEALRSLLIWAAIGLALVTLYTYQDGFKALPSQIVGALVPSEPQTEADTVRIRASTGGHFVTRGDINGARIRMLIDTGATSVVLTRHDARRAGFDVKALQYTDFARTANGVTQVAPVRLREVKIGSITVRNVRAVVAGDGLDQSLLGMSFLSRLSSYEFTTRELILRP